jgi:hypothetical protein
MVEESTIPSVEYNQDITLQGFDKATRHDKGRNNRSDILEHM